MAGPVACTIVSNNYLAFARVLSRSFLEQHPDGRFFTLVVDRPHPDLDYSGEPFEVVFSHQLPIPNYSAFAFRYSILELNTAVKPFFLGHLRDEYGVEALCYFDPDILILQPLQELYGYLETHNLVLTPHILAPPEDRKKPGERDFLLSGTYNLGFLGLAFNDETKGFLSWWSDKLYTECRHDVKSGLFVDQRWMDLAPSLVDEVKIVRDPVYNIAYWNIAQRPVKKVGNSWEVQGKAVRFFHFSGVDPHRPEAVSKHQDRFTMSDLPSLRPLFAEYCDRLLHEGFDDLVKIPYGLNEFDNGAPVLPAMRSKLAELDPVGSRWPRPFEAASADGYYRWLLEGLALGEPSLPRVAILLWESRPDLQHAFPRPTRTDLRAFLEWMCSSDGQQALGGEPWRSQVQKALEQLGTDPAANGSRPPGEGDAELGPWTVLAEGARHRGWLASDIAGPVDQEPRITPLALSIRRRRRDLQSAFPDPLGTSRVPFAYWFSTFGWREYGLPFDLVNPVLSSLPTRQRLRAHAWRLATRLGWRRPN